MRAVVNLRFALILIALFATFMISPKQIEKLGDSYQIALPMIGLGCALANGQLVDYSIRFASQWSVVQSSKSLLGAAAINQRPNGHGRGMPSGHTATAVFGASYIATSCSGGNIWMKSAAYLTAIFVGGSRIEAKAHDIWQVLLGALVGWLGDRAFRKISPKAWLRRVMRRGG